MTLPQLKSVACSGSMNSSKFLPYINNTCAKYNIVSPAQQLCFLAQACHESGGLFYTEELATGQAYEGRADLGNTHPGDGVKYKGRGLIQITGRNNYSQLSIEFKIDFINDPTLLSGRNINFCSPGQLEYAALSAGWFWNRAGLNAPAGNINLYEPVDEGNNLELFREITRRINGGYNGLADRAHRFNQGVNLFINPAGQPAPQQNGGIRGTVT